MSASGTRREPRKRALNLWKRSSALRQASVETIPAVVSPRTGVLALCLGNAVQWYDFALYGAFATIIGPLFFPAQNPATVMLAAFGAHGIALVVRPIGAVIFGRSGGLPGGASPVAMARDRLPADALVIGRADLTAYFNQVDASAPQGVNESPKRCVIQFDRMQDRASGFYGLDLTKVFEQVQRHSACYSDLVRRLCHPRLDP